MADKKASARMKYVWELIKNEDMDKSAAFKKAYEKYPKKEMKKEMKKDMKKCDKPKKK